MLIRFIAIIFATLLPFSRGMLGQELKLFEEIFLHIHHRTS
jgi:hypothetical protein